ncbi:FAD/NAD(P)-binding domain-containing protein [Wolfiporia cocos MD-104 SS10]|uniref:FAD/NAD(P)-binding domain-containing protein n=1 Tax=Wolfiporia cocos (strain MD-104) TaxID=742152 RepID=A0A2H3JM31_WOLCO|nr:FAD/NAD(P)-binding domain-containing protein [Wolfiporia cocos MD-104 SS10]
MSAVSARDQATRNPQLPTSDKLHYEIPADQSPLALAKAWCQSFSLALQSVPLGGQLAQLILEDGFWRDLYALSWDFRSIHGISLVVSYLEAHLSVAGFRSVNLIENGLQAPAFSSPFPDLTFLQLCFDFETSIGKCLGICRLVNNEGHWKAYTVTTSLEEFHKFPERIGAMRNPTFYQGTWAEKRQAEVECPNNDPTVVIIGAGHTGLETAARLNNLGVPTLVIEKTARIGDVWRHRYKTLSLHDPVWYDQMPLMPFPAPWPKYAPATKLGDWFEAYAQTLEINVWTSSHISSAKWDSTTKKWNIVVQRGASTRSLIAKHIIVATGVSGGVPNIPNIPGRAEFGGLVLHSSQFTSAADYLGKRVLVIGACNSGQDIAHDFANYGADVTMFQRSSTFVMSVKVTDALVGDLYNENVPIDHADRLNFSFPFAVVRLLHQRLFPHFAATIDRDLLEDLNRVGFRTNCGPDNAGVLPLWYCRAGGYFIDTGAAQKIIDGQIKLKSGGAIERYTRTGVCFMDGTDVAADVVIYATGYADGGDARATVKDICDPEVLAKLKPVWGVDEEDELRSVWRDSGHEGLWFAMGNFPISRFYSRFLAMRIKAQEEGLTVNL